MSKDDWFYPTAFSSWDDRERRAIIRVMDSGRLTMGEEVGAFEEEFAAFHGRKHGIMVNSGSSANLVAVACLFNLRRNPLSRDDDQWTGRYAIVPALAWSTTYAPLVQYGLKPFLVDCDETWNAPEPLTFKGSRYTRLIVTCSILGNPGYGQDWCEAAAYEGGYVIEDNCESFGAIDSKEGRLCGTLGHLSTFSFFWSHQISAIEGGMILTDDDEMARLCRMLRAHGWTRDVEKPDRFQDEYDFQVMGYNVRPLEMHAAVAREQLKKAKEHQRRRIENLMHFVTLCAGLPIKFQTSNGTLNPFGIPFTCEREADRADLVTALRANRIDCRLPTGGSFRLHKYGAACGGQQTPNADRIHRTGMFLGNAPFDISDKIEKTVRIIRAVFDAKARAA